METAEKKAPERPKSGGAERRLAWQRVLGAARKYVKAFNEVDDLEPEAEERLALADKALEDAARAWSKL